jgi:hypothetical protein
MAGINGSGDVRDLTLALYGVNGSNEQTAVEMVVPIRRTERYTRQAADTAGSNYTEYFAVIPGGKWQVTAASIMPGTNLTGHDTNYKTIALGYAASAGAATNFVSNTTKLTGGTGSWTAGTVVSLTLTASNCVVDATSAAQYLVLTLTASGTGVSIPANTTFLVTLVPVN